MADSPKVLVEVPKCFFVLWIIVIIVAIFGTVLMMRTENKAKPQSSSVSK